METKTIRADQVRENDILPGMDNAYVYDVEEDPDFRDRYNVGLARGMFCLTVHDQEGSENMLLLYPSARLDVQRVDWSDFEDEEEE